MKARTFKRIDAGKLLASGVEPCETVFRAIAELKPGEGLAVSAPFLPSPLIEKLRAEGFTSRVEQQGGGWIARFWRDDEES